METANIPGVIVRLTGRQYDIPKADTMKKSLLALLLIAALSGSLRAGAFTENHYIFCGAIVELGPVGYPTWAQASIVRPAEHGQVFIFTDEPFPDSLVYKSDYGFLGMDTFVVACARATQITCDTGIYIMHVIGCPPVSAFTETHQISCDSTLLVPGLGYPFWVRPEIIQGPAYGQAVILGADALTPDTLQYVPPPGFSGTDTVLVECAHATQITCETGIYIIEVSCTSRSLEALPGLGLRVFPNPAGGVLHVNSSMPLGQVTISTAAGIPVRFVRPPTPLQHLEISLEGLPSGWYVLTAWSGGVLKSAGFVVR